MNLQRIVKADSTINYRMIAKSYEEAIFLLEDRIWKLESKITELESKAAINEKNIKEIVEETLYNIEKYDDSVIRWEIEALEERIKDLEASAE